MSNPYSKFPSDPDELITLRKELLYAYIGGIVSVGALADYLKLEHTQENLKAIRGMISTADFIADAKKGRDDQIASVLERFRESLHLYATEAEKIAFGGEERNRVAMLKDLMDRAGTGAALKLAATTPSEYKKFMADLLSDPAEKKG